MAGLIAGLITALPATPAYAAEQAAIDGCIDRIRNEYGGKGGEAPAG